jgi:hypothetical protein
LIFLRIRAEGEMKLAAILAIAVSAGATERNATICMEGRADVQVVMPARELATEIFAGAGVTIHWYQSTRCPQAPDVIRIGFSKQAPQDTPDSALAYALPYEGTHIVVLYEQVRAVAAAPQVLLAYVLVHEITHVLQGICRHSETGIMKARWEHDDYYAMKRRMLSFSETDVYLLHRGLDTRDLRMAEGKPALVAAR